MSLLAHQGGWDEALFVIGPLLFIVAVLRLAKNRADRANRARDVADRSPVVDAPGSGPDSEPT